MRNFFIKSFEAIASIIVVIGVVAIIAGAVSVSQLPQGGIARAIGVLIGGFVYLSLLVGGIYLVIGIHDNTRRTAAAVEELLRRQR
ncbi:hypothetical protein [Paracoccus marinus]|uniref:hypothetical protein n=1 Tax=Paracoccus marinus TaxID=288426 RepID=UPI001038DD08|nr:hypothetical protein [Paracoccus marinus]GLS81220.1 hypothetical protein GCM10007893_20210 [Paracoccus marinus]